MRARRERSRDVSVTLKSASDPVRSETFEEYENNKATSRKKVTALINKAA